uniref:Transcriptional regulator n=1 Tax=Fervidobacterium pennivorans TaxID=93466 RepID=A0A7V4KEY9_FERPE
MIWNKVGFVVASRQRTEVFLLLKECSNVEEIKQRVKQTSANGVKRILKDFAKEGLVVFDDSNVRLTELGKEVMEKVSQMRFL